MKFIGDMYTSRLFSLCNFGIWAKGRYAFAALLFFSGFGIVLALNILNYL
jgi:hypothetical protein